MSEAGFEARLGALALELPNVPVPIAKFRPWRRAGDLVYLAGQVCEWNGVVKFVGKLGVEHDLEAGLAAARICALNLIAALRQACTGDLDRVDHCVRLGGFVNCAPDFDRVPFVVNGASDLMVELFGESGEHCRTAVGVASLPQCAAVEVDAVFRLRP
ncbi:RidA family protein [Bauldia litoralis]|uniref:RidA family protein n=1 Tax=Bauldia litoralis TaxID=665467 RepID=UPI003263025E